MQDVAAKVAAMIGHYRTRLIGIAAYFAGVAGIVTAVWWYGFTGALGQIERRAQSDLALASDSLVGELKRFRELAVLSADRPQMRGVLTGAVQAEVLRDVLQEVADKTGAIQIALVDSDGRVLVGTQGEQINHLGTAYFERAMDGALGIDHGVMEGMRSFTFAAPVFSREGPVIGAVLVAAGVEAVEGSWRGASPVFYFTDAQGVVFLANRSELVLRARGVADFVAHDETLWGGREVWRLDGGRYLPERALHLTQDLPVIEMRGEILLDIAPARQLAFLQAAAVSALCLAFGALLFFVMQRRRSLALANVKLERRVRERTAQLVAANTDLKREVAERRAAEAQLTKAQADLVQAGKLSALGQMSAGISHELNQPLMAIQSFAENGVRFLERGKTDTAAQNLGRISELAHRMGRIIRNLRAFSRQEVEPFTNVDIGKVVDAVLELLGPKISEAGVEVKWLRPKDMIVRGGEVRLQQVVLNLAANAIDAMAASEPKVLMINVVQDVEKTVISVRDTGPGIKEPEKIFDPFYSTKAVGAAEGLGLGLSISYGLVQSFGGAIRGRNHEDGGAIFTVELIPAVQEAAT